MGEVSPGHQLQRSVAIKSVSPIPDCLRVGSGNSCIATSKDVKTMKIDKAIIILTIHNDHNPNYTDAERRQAHQLGIEALKRCQYIAEHTDRWHNVLLPGETKAI